MKRKYKISVLYLAKWIGLFHVSKYLTRKGLRILCYHNYSHGEEVDWAPLLFIKPETFNKRMEFLKKNQFPILKLKVSLDLLYKEEIPASSVVITIDDGWEGIKKYAHKILKKNAFPYTIYVTSYYSLKESPIFNLIIPYMIWKAYNNGFNFEKLKLPKDISIPNIFDYDKLASKIIEYGYTKLSNEERYLFAKDIGKQTGISYGEIDKNGVFSLLTTSGINDLFHEGVDIQLHSHRHQWPMSEKAAINEIEKNREYLESITGVCLEHFCYPSGIWKQEQFPYLYSQGIKSATTCDSGFNYSNTNRFRLHRFLDSQDISQIEFEAEINGFLEIMRKSRKIYFVWKGARKPQFNDDLQ